jgi:transposase-like protein
MRLIGYPTKNSLKSWHLEYERCHDLRTGYVRSRPRYSAEQKRAAVDHYLSHDRCASATLRALGYPSRGAFAAWIEELCPEIGKRIVGRVAGSVPKSQEAKRRQELISQNLLKYRPEPFYHFYVPPNMPPTSPDTAVRLLIQV